MLEGIGAGEKEGIFMKWADQINDYFIRLKQTFDELDLNSIEQFVRCIRGNMGKDAHIYVFGNGGSGATASHMVCDMNKGVCFGKEKRLKFHCLNDNVPTLMAYSNDVSYDSIFEEQLKNFLRPQDMVIGISGSGNSTNVIKAIQYANSLGAKTIGMTGFDGGQLKPLVALCIHVPINDMQKVEDIHLMIVHIAMQLLRQANEI